MANSLLDLNDDQFKRLLGKGIPDECVEYYLGDTDELSSSIKDLKVIDTPGYAARNANDLERQTTLNELLTIMEQRCYQDVKRVIVTNNFYKDMPKHLYADDFSDLRVLDRYVKLIGINK
jgi:hypothetical protein